jgi:pyruvate/2-oxoglutarate dehydrogenase complex dihydrolipoamide dehydrogenase (E3) component
MDEYKKIGIKTVTCSNITAVVNKGTKESKSLTLTCAKNGDSEGFEELIYAVGRHANLTGLSMNLYR